MQVPRFNGCSRSPINTGGAALTLVVAEVILAQSKTVLAPRFCWRLLRFPYVFVQLDARPTSLSGKMSPMQCPSAGLAP